MNNTLLIVVIMLLGACKSSQPTANGENPDQNVAGIEVIDSGANGAMLEKKQVLISDEDAWKTLWENTHANKSPMPPLPKVDWNNYRLVAAFMGQRPSGGYTVSIENVEIKGKYAELTVVHGKPGASCFVPMVLSQPYTIAKIKGKFREIKPTIKDITQNCN